MIARAERAIGPAGHGVRLLLALAVLAMSACAPMRAVESRIPTTTVTGPASDGATLVVVLPGRRDSLRDLERLEVAATIHAEWPNADVVLTDAGLPYYMEQRLAQRLHGEIVAPARARGYRHVWLVGASLGGLGALDFIVRQPGAADGAVLLAPYLGEEELIDEIARAGGVHAWDPASVGDAGDATGAIRNVWRGIRAWREPLPVFVACGDRDELKRALPLLAPVLGEDHVIVRPGGHRWTVWLPALRELLRKAESHSNASPNITSRSNSTGS